MINKVSRNKMRLIRHKRVRENLSGTNERPRLNVFRSNSNITAQNNWWWKRHHISKCFNTRKRAKNK